MCSKNLKKLVFSLVMATGLGFLAGTCVGGVRVQAAGLPSGYEQLTYVEFNNPSGNKETMKIPFSLSSSNESYSWELVISNLSKPETNGSLVGMYKYSVRTGYLYVNTYANCDYGTRMGLAIGNATHFGESGITNLGIIDEEYDNPFTVRAEINKNGHGFSVSETKNEETITNTTYGGDMPTDTTFVLTGCWHGEEFMHFKFYGVTILDGAGNVKVNMVPAKDTSTGAEGAYDLVSGNFYPKYEYNKMLLLEFDYQGGVGGESAPYFIPNGTPVDGEFPVPTKEGYYFGGFYSAPNGKGDMYIDENGIGTRLEAAFSSNSPKLYAYWISNSPAPTHSPVSFLYNFISRPVVKEEVKPVIIDHDTYKSEAPSKSVIATENPDAKDFFDLKVHSVDDKSIENQEMLARYLIGANSQILLTEGIYPRRDLTTTENGSDRYLIWNNLPKDQAGPVYAVIYNQTDGAYVINGVFDANGTATFTGFKLRPASTITICK